MKTDSVGGWSEELPSRLGVGGSNHGLLGFRYSVSYSGPFVIWIITVIDVVWHLLTKQSKRMRSVPIM